MDPALSAQRIQRDLEELSRFTSTPGQGCTRLPFTPQTRAAADYLKQRMTQAGLQAREDGAGNVFGVLPGRDRALPCVMCGSHYDTVYQGGGYDGIAGVACAIELARVLREEGIALPMDYVAAAFMDEEGCRFGNGYFGSRAMLGEMTAEECRRYADRDGVTVYDAMRDYGLVPEEIGRAAWPAGSIGRFLEIHIEQGPVLDARNIELGIVECIVGIQRYLITVRGRADHAGTTPMDMRLDAVDMASRVISQIAPMARSGCPGTVATVGYLVSEPGAVNIVARQARFSVDIRSPDGETVERIAGEIRALLERETARAGAGFEMKPTLSVPPLALSAAMGARMERSCREHGYTCLRLPSGAGHDSLAIGRSIETAMLFVPSRDGRSHCPEEYTPAPAFGKAVQILYDLICGL